MFSLRINTTLLGQGLLTSVGLACLAFWPGGRNTVLLVPVGSTSLAETANFATRNSSRLVALGPFAGTLLVSGSKALPLESLRAGYLPFGWPSPACGARS